MSVSPIIAQLLLNRGMKTPDEGKRFLDAPLVGLHAPGLMPGINEAVERLTAAIEAKKRICIYGDYDVDGITGTSILWGLFNRLEVPVEYYVPRRLEEGYGLNSEALRSLAEKGVQVVITVDCGIASLAEADEAKRLGLELIITDHHEMKDTLPDAAVLVHPRLPGTNYPFGGISGAGVAFKLAWALAMKSSGSEKVSAPIREYLLDAVALAALGLIADVVPLIDENRIYVRAGLDRLRKNPPLGMKALIESAGLSATPKLRAEDVGYKLAPRMNAAGRLGYAGLVVEMLTTANAVRAKEIAQHLENENSARQTLERRMTQQAKDMLEGEDLTKWPAIVLSHSEWHAGVIGIVASRLVDAFGRPTLIIAAKEGQPIATGSGRSIPGFELHHALNACSDDLIGHGGHSMAAGFKISPPRIPAFRERFNAYAAKHFPKGTPPAPCLDLDAETPLSMLTLGLMKDIAKLEPYGAQNPLPRFLAGDLEITGDPRKVGQGERTLQFRVKQGPTTMKAVGFGMGERLEELMSAGGKCCLAFTPIINEWQGRSSVELQVADFQAGPEARFEVR
ncbi:MAG: single-stranded-DNA-specific exonuclease RecJ [Planctomycetes bacterium]|nr:single-stranded-DNA-specific exonuclease RecJ [Planctomycetota bacterium]